MKELQQDFLQKSTVNLEKLKKDLLDEGLTEDWRRAAFRTLHTIKGTAQTFGFIVSGHLAHELENLLPAAKSASNENFKNLLTEGFELLKKSFEQNDFEIPAEFLEKINSNLPQDVKSAVKAKNSLIEIPNEFSGQLSQTERLALDSAARSGKNLYIFEVGFDFADFADGFKNFREVLNASGEIIATASSANFIGKIGFQILFASAAEFQEIEKIADDYSAEIIFQSSENNFPNTLDGVLSKVAAHGKSLANKLGKKIDFEIKAEEINLSPEKLKLVFDVLLHIVRNAVDHAFKAPEGKIKIQIKAEKDAFYLIVADNGNGVDLEKVRSRAVEKNLISANENLSEQATLDLIFQSELSTAEKLTEISGRGVGLDAVKYAVESAGGKISVSSRTKKGTTFEILLPK